MVPGLALGLFGAMLFCAGEAEADSDPPRAGSPDAAALFASQRVTKDGLFTTGVEGPSSDPAGDVYVCNLGVSGTIGRVRVGSADPELFLRLPPGSIPNGSRFDKSGRMFIADWKGHNVFVVAPGWRVASVYFHSDEFHQPNDLAVSSDGAVFASDPDFHTNAGRIWRIAKESEGGVFGAVMPADRSMGLTNGLDLSPDEKTLYVSEFDTNEVWAYAIEGGRLTRSKMIYRFDGGGQLDGLRTDADGRIFVARNGAGSIAILGADGALIREIPTLAPKATNLTFGGQDGRTIYVTNASTRAVERFLTDRPGREFCWRDPRACAGSN